jgi:hypothetical protein
MSLDNVVSKDDITQTRESRVIDEVMLLMKLTYPLIIAEDIDKLGCIIISCIIMLCNFFSYELFSILLFL